MECEERCTVEWSVPNDHGAEITGYRIIVQELASDNEDNDDDDDNNDNIANSEETTTADSEDNDDDDKEEEEKEKNVSEEMTTAISSQEKAESQENQEEEEADKEKTGSQEFDDDTTDNDSESDKNRQDIGSPFVVEVGPEENQLELTHIKPHTYYRVSVAAQNEVGWGEATQIEHETDGRVFQFIGRIPKSTNSKFQTSQLKPRSSSRQPKLRLLQELPYCSFCWSSTWFATLWMAAEWSPASVWIAWAEGPTGGRRMSRLEGKTKKTSINGKNQHFQRRRKRSSTRERRSTIDYFAIMILNSVILYRIFSSFAFIIYSI